MYRPVPPRGDVFTVPSRPEKKYFPSRPAEEKKLPSRPAEGKYIYRPVPPRKKIFTLPSRQG